MKENMSRRCNGLNTQ